MLIRYPDSNGETTPGFILKFKKDVEFSNATGASSVTFTHSLGKVINSNDGRGGCDRYDFVPKAENMDAYHALMNAWNAWVEENVEKMLPFLDVLHMDFAKEGMENRTGEYVDHFCVVFSEMFRHGFIVKDKK